MKAVIMAGGRGTRIAKINSEVPKPMISILGKPILEYQIEVLKEQGYTDIILVVGYLGKVIQDYFGDGNRVSPATGKPFGVKIQYIVEQSPLGTAGALYYLKGAPADEILLLNGDIIFDIDIERFLQFHRSAGGMATILTHPNGHPYDSGIIVSNENKQVENWMNKEDERLWYKNRVNAGIHILSAALLNQFAEPKRLDLDRDVLKPLIPQHLLYVYDSPEYVKDMGTPDRFYEVIEDIRTGRVKAKNLGNRQKAIFLDRDGTINKYVGFLRNIDDFELVDGVADAIRRINRSGYLAIVVTNQPVIARGEVSLEELELIHKKMETLLGQKGAYLDDIFYCPHHPDRGFTGEREEYKIDCECRKPKPGMLLKAAEKYNIDLTKSWMIGDGENDLEAGKRAGCSVVYIGENRDDGIPTFHSLSDCIDNILS